MEIHVHVYTIMCSMIDFLQLKLILGGAVVVIVAVVISKSLTHAHVIGLPSHCVWLEWTK